jgi:hypothetical protein
MGLSSVVAFRGFREAKIENFDGPVGPELHIGRFEIAVNDAAQVSFFERGRNLVGNRARLVDGDRALCDSVGKRRAFNELQHQRSDIVGFSQKMQRLLSGAAGDLGDFGRSDSSLRDWARNL